VPGGAGCVPGGVGLCQGGLVCASGARPCRQWCTRSGVGTVPAHRQREGKSQLLLSRAVMSVSLLFPLSPLSFPLSSPFPLHGVAQRPDQAGLQKLVPALGEAMGKANGLTEGKRRATFNHAKAVAESLSCLTWVLYTDKGCGERPPPPLPLPPAPPPHPLAPPPCPSPRLSPRSPPLAVASRGCCPPTRDEVRGPFHLPPPLPPRLVLA